MFKLQAMTMTMAVAVAAAMLLIAQCGAANVERQRRVQTSATSTSSGGIAGELARLGLPLRHATYETNDEFYETSSKSMTKTQQPAAAPAPVPVQPEPEFKVFDLLSGGELSVAQVNQLLLLNAQAEPAQQLGLVPLPLAGTQDEARVLFGFKHHHDSSPTPPATPPATPGGPPAGPATPSNMNVQVTSVTVPATTAAPADTTGTGTRFAPQMLPLQYFQNRQVAPLAGLPYGALDGSNFGYGASQVPLVPISLGNNAVGYVPLNLRMFRQLIDATAGSGSGLGDQYASPFTVTTTLTRLPIRESEEAAVSPLASADNEQEVVDEADEPAAPSSVASVVSTEKATLPNRLQIFGQSLRQLPVLTFAKNLRRVQLL